MALSTRARLRTGTLFLLALPEWLYESQQVQMGFDGCSCCRCCCWTGWLGVYSAPTFPTPECDGCARSVCLTLTPVNLQVGIQLAMMLPAPKEISVIDALVHQPAGPTVVVEAAQMAICGTRRSGPPGCSSRGAPAAAPPSASVAGRWRVGEHLACDTAAESGPWAIKHDVVRQQCCASCC